MLCVSGPEPTRGRRGWDSMATIVEAEEPDFLDEDAWAVVGLRSKPHEP